MAPFILNIPNMFTMLRFIMLPIVVCPLLPIFGSHTQLKLALSLGAFILASISDYFDGFFARKLNQTTKWGAYMDSLADKMLVWFAWAAFVFIPFLNIPLWTLIVVVLRDLMVTRMRNYYLKHNLYFKTSLLGKLKTALQMIVIGMILLYLFLSLKFYQINELTGENYLAFWLPKYKFLYDFPRNALIGTSILTLFSGIDYAVAVFRQRKNKT